jgi:ATP-dependent Clp protease ATP-binding subunit ClpB
MLRQLEISDAAVSLALRRELDRLPAVSGATDASRIYITDTLNDILARAEKAAQSLKDEYVSVEHLLIGAVETDKDAKH